jgi:hypothetical protein
MRRLDIFGSLRISLFLFSAVASSYSRFHLTLAGSSLPDRKSLPDRSDYRSSIFTSVGLLHLLQTLNKLGQKWRNCTGANGVIDWRIGRWLNARLSIAIIDLEQQPY